MKPPVWVPPKSARWAAPKSASLALPAASKKMLAGLTSRWTMPARWAAASADSSSSASRRPAAGSRWSLARQRLGQGAAGQVLEHQDARRARRASQQAHDVRVAQPARGLGLAQEALERLAFGAAAAGTDRQDLQGHGIAQQPVLGARRPGPGLPDADQLQVGEPAQRLGGQLRGRRRPAARSRRERRRCRAAPGSCAAGGGRSAGRRGAGPAPPARRRASAELRARCWRGGRRPAGRGRRRAAGPAAPAGGRGAGGRAPPARSSPSRAAASAISSYRRPASCQRPARLQGTRGRQQRPAPLVKASGPLAGPGPLGQLGGFDPAAARGEGSAGRLQLGARARRGWCAAMASARSSARASSARRIARARSPRRSARGSASANRQTRSSSWMARRRSPHGFGAAGRTGVVAGRDQRAHLVGHLGHHGIVWDPEGPKPPATDSAGKARLRPRDRS